MTLMGFEPYDVTVALSFSFSISSDAYCQTESVTSQCNGNWIVVLAPKLLGYLHTLFVTLSYLEWKKGNFLRRKNMGIYISFLF